MNRFSLLPAIAIAAGIFCISGTRLQSQETLAVVVPKTPQQQLAALKAANAELLQKQQSTLKKLDDLQKQAEQLRIMTKRG